MHCMLTCGVVCRCAPGTDSLPVVVEQSACNLRIEWSTYLACKDDFKPIDCKVFSPSGDLYADAPYSPNDGANDVCRYDLTSLMRSQHNYGARSDAIDFELNVCRPIVPVRGTCCMIMIQ